MKNNKNKGGLIITGIALLAIVGCFSGSNTTNTSNSGNSQEVSSQPTYSTVEPSIIPSPQSTTSSTEKPKDTPTPTQQITPTPKSNTNTSSQSTSTSTKSTVQSNTKVYSTPSPTTSQQITSQNTTEEMVWVGNTGTKYHHQNCGTLKGKGHQITMKQALAEGRTACKVCY